MTDHPSEAALRKACEVLGITYHKHMYHEANSGFDHLAVRLARHFDAEDKAAREALSSLAFSAVHDFARIHILPDPKPTLRSILLDESLNVEAKERAIRDAGLLRGDES